MYGSNHEKNRAPLKVSRISWLFWSKKGRTASKMFAEQGEKVFASKHFKGRKRKTFRDLNG